MDDWFKPLAYALILLQLGLFVMNLRGIEKNPPEEAAPMAGRTASAAGAYGKWPRSGPPS